MKRTLIPLFLLPFLLLAGCADSADFRDGLDETVIDQVRITLAMGNPDYGADAKIITDPAEIKALIDTFQDAQVGELIPSEDVYVAHPSTYAFYSGDELVWAATFNGNDSNRLWLEDGWHYVDYPSSAKLPFELYQQSEAETLTVDWNGLPLTSAIS